MPSKTAWRGYRARSRRPRAREDGRSILKGGWASFSPAQCFSASMLLRAEIGAIIGVSPSSHPLHETWLHLTHTLTIEQRSSPLLLSCPSSSPLALLRLSSSFSPGPSCVLCLFPTPFAVGWPPAPTGAQQANRTPAPTYPPHAAPLRALKRRDPPPLDIRHSRGPIAMP